ncbi:MAG: oligopeptide transporter, OPT family [Acidobacteriota bacterium]|jgi:putative OPT family oligopeptide transporter|nr:oligopeptide transporter, OPT family [Acidobacteriota bacterium]
MKNNPFLAVFRPYIPDSVTNMRELSIFPLIVGTILGVIFGASSLYLVLKVGLTVSASIPVAVISITLFRLLSKIGVRDATILEHNIVQTAGSAGESIAFGLGVTMPAILILGFDLEISRVMLVAVLGGLLGIFMMIPLRRALIRDQHGYLKYPEGTACAEVLKAGASQESRAASIESERVGADDAATTGGKVIAVGFGIGFLFNSLMQVFKGWKESPGKEFDAPFRGGSVSLENNPALLGVGYIIGPRIAGIMFAGGALSYLVLIPMIKYFGAALLEPLAPATSKLISEMAIQGKDSIQSTYVLYIGAGAVAAGGMISLARSLPTIWNGLKGGLADFRGGTSSAENENQPRTDRDLSLKWVIIGILALIVVITFAPSLEMNLLGAILIIVFGFLFVTVSSRLTGEIGSSSNPISGMTVATLLLTCLVFLLVGWTQPDPYFITALSVGGIVCIAASNGGTTSQDLKTGFWVGGTPWKQQIAILVGATVSALVLGPILIQLNNSSTVYQRVEPTAFSQQFVVPEQQLLRDGGQLKSETVNEPGLNDTAAYRVWHNTDAKVGAEGRYLIDTQGKPVYLVDPGINGTVQKRADGSSVTKYNAPKATLMSYIIKGILSQELPWGLVLLGVMIAIVLELSGIPSLAFAVGLYLPISVSAPIFVGGIVRWAVDKDLIKKLRRRNLSEEEIIAETDRSPGVLLASGYIAGGALAGILVAVAAEFLSGTVTSFEKWSELNNPFFAGPNSDWLGMIPFWILALVLYYVGRGLLLSGRRND